MQDSQLRSANFQEADLRGAKLQRANMKNADLRGSQMQDANFKEANLKGAKLKDAFLSGAQQMQACKFDELNPLSIRKCKPRVTGQLAKHRSQQ